VLLPKGEIAHLTQPTRRDLRICLRSRAKGLYPKRSKPGYAFEFACVRSLPVTTASQGHFRGLINRLVSGGQISLESASDAVFVLVPGGDFVDRELGCLSNQSLQVLSATSPDGALRYPRFDPAYPAKTLRKFEKIKGICKCSVNTYVH
jgi:hypothetical protein